MFGRRGSITDWGAQSDRTQEALRAYFKLIDPRRNEDSAKELRDIGEALERHGEWSKDEEWRISTSMTASIRPEVAPDGKTWFRVKVECDGQVLSCRCPSAERAFYFYSLYAHLIIYQFYSVGPPWAE